MFDKLAKYGVIPVVAVDSVDEGLKLCEALANGGLPVAEITFRTEAAEPTIKAVSKEFPEFLLGAGTVLNVKDLDRAIDAGATFAVSPGCNPTVVSAAIERNFDFAPGICTPSDVEAATSLGVRSLKFFPAEAVGGIPLLKSIIAPYAHLGIEICPTGGININNLCDYLSIPQVKVAGGTWIAKKDLVKEGKWSTISDLAKAAVEKAQSVNC